MSKTVLLVLLFGFVLVLVLLIGWYLARKVKDDLETQSGSAAGASAEFKLPEDRITQLRALTTQPILLKQSEEGVRVQIDSRPMVPLAVFLGKEVSTALGEAAAGVTNAFGASWVVLVTPKEDGHVSVHRLA
jgi:hypothetical protein